MLITDISREVLDESKLRKLYELYLDDVQSVTINRDYSRLARNIQKRLAITCLLKKVETRLIQKANRVFERRRNMNTKTSDYNSRATKSRNDHVEVSSQSKLKQSETSL